jgi:surface antigen
MTNPHDLNEQASRLIDTARSTPKRTFRNGRIIAVCLFALPLSLTACQNNEQTGALVGTGGGALVGGVLGNVIGHSTASTLIGAGVGGAIGYFAGSAIGRNLDEADRARASAATQQALAAPAYYPPSGAPPKPPAHPVNWVSDHNTNTRGSATVVAVNKEPRGDHECRTVREVAYIKGQEEVQNSRYCRSTDGSWAPVQA